MQYFSFTVFNSRRVAELEQFCFLVLVDLFTNAKYLDQ